MYVLEAPIIAHEPKEFVQDCALWTTQHILSSTVNVAQLEAVITSALGIDVSRSI